MDKNLIKKHLKTSLFGNNILTFNLIDSTNTYGKKICKEGSYSGTLIISEKQTMGRGRQEKPWLSVEGKGIYMSLILDNDLSLNKLMLLPHLIAASIHSTFKKYNIHTRIKWPNDIYLNNKKISGILIEQVFDNENKGHIILGIGVNISLDISDISPDLINKASSIKIETGIDLNREEFIAFFLNDLELRYENFKLNNNINFLNICRNNSLIIGENIKYIYNNSVFKGKVLDICDDGSLLIEKSTLEKIKLISGEVSIIL